MVLPGEVCLVVGEVSMISKIFMAKLSRNIRIGRITSTPHPQTPLEVLASSYAAPVAGSVSDALYNPKCTVQKHKSTAKAGRAIFEEFTIVVSLTSNVECRP